MSGNLFIVSAPSGAGKTSLLKELVKRMDNIAVSISSTTRPMRAGEVDGQHYHFLDLETFQASVESGEFLEHAVVFGNYYGTSRTAVKTQLVSGQDVILEIDWQGAQQARKSLPDNHSIFILPPSTAALRERLQGRATDDAEVIARRLGEARDDMRHYEEYDYVVVNDDFQTALQDLVCIVRSLRLCRQAQVGNLAPMLAELLDQP